MIEIMIGAIFTYTWGLLLLRVVTKRQLSPAALRASLMYGLFVLILAVVNFEEGIISQKGASQQAFEALLGSGATNSTFTVQAFVNAVPFLVTGAWWSAIGTNVAAMAIAFAYVYNEDRRLARWLLAPAIVNFAMFSLRDPLIGFAMLFLTIRMLERHVGGVRRRLGEYFLAFVTFIARPELIAVYLGTKVFGGGRPSRATMWRIALIPIILPLTIYALTYLPVLLGYQTRSSLSSLPDLFNDFFIRRAGRNSDAGSSGGSNILGGQLLTMPVFIRFPIQVVAFFLLPLPFEISSVTLALAFVDSMFFIVLARRFWRYADPLARRFFVFYVVAISFFVANYGNLLRLRLPAYFMMIGALLYVQRRAAHEQSPAASTNRPRSSLR